MARFDKSRVQAFSQAIRDLAEAAERFDSAALYDARDEAERVAIALGRDLVPPKPEA